MGLKHACGLKCPIDTSRFVEISRYVGAASKRPVPAWKAVVGESVFAHESGLHVDGVLKDPRNYEPFEPGEVGSSRQLVLGKHAGRHGLAARIQGLGLDSSAICLSTLLRRVRAISQRRKRPIEDSELEGLFRSLAQSSPQPGDSPMTKPTPALKKAAEA